MFSWNSYAETFVCSFILNGDIHTTTYKRQGDIFLESAPDVDISFKMQIYNESDNYLALVQMLPGLGLSSIYIDKNTRKFGRTTVNTSMNNPELGKCVVN